MTKKDDGARSGQRRAIRWGAAFERWLAARGRSARPGTVEIDRKAVEALLAFCGKPAWRINRQDVEGFINHLAECGRTDPTIQNQLRAIRKFYAFCSQEQVDPWLHRRGGFDPTRGVKWESRDPGEGVFYLDEGEEAALLDMLREVDSPMGKRDYALILCMLKTGCKGEAVGKLKIAAISDKRMNPSPQPSPKGRGSDWRSATSDLKELRPLGLPVEVREAIFEWLRAAGRLAGLQDGEYIFSPSRNPLQYEATDNPTDWDTSHPLMRDRISRLIHQYAGYAGLRAERINPQTLRNTRARRMLMAGQPPEEIARSLGIRDMSYAREYLRAVAGASNAGFAGEDAPARETYWTGSHAPVKPGERRRLIHGLYTQQLLPEIEAMQASGALEGEHPLKAIVLHYQRALERAHAMMDDENIPLSRRVQLVKGVRWGLIRLLRAQKALRLAEETYDPKDGREGSGPREQKKRARSGRYDLYGRENFPPKLSVREKQRRQDEAHHRLNLRRQRTNKRNPPTRNPPMPPLRRGVSSRTTHPSSRRAKPDEAPRYHVDFLNEHEAGEEN